MPVLLRLWFLVLCVLAGAFAPSRAGARVSETRTWVFAPEVVETRLETEPQAAATHQENGLWNYEHAPGCCLAPERVADGSVRFKRWVRGDAIDKPLPDGSAPSWETVQSRYWKNRHQSSKKTGEFTTPQLDEMNKGNAPMDFNPRTMQWERRELHHVDPQRHVIDNSPMNLRELTPDWHAEVDPMRKVPGIQPIRGIR